MKDIMLRLRISGWFSGLTFFEPIILPLGGYLSGNAVAAMICLGVGVVWGFAA